MTASPAVGVKSLGEGGNRPNSSVTVAAAMAEAEPHSGLRYCLGLRARRACLPMIWADQSGGEKGCGNHRFPGKAVFLFTEKDAVGSHTVGTGGGAGHDPGPMGGV